MSSQHIAQLRRIPISIRSGDVHTDQPTCTQLIIRATKPKRFERSRIWKADDRVVLFDCTRTHIVTACPVYLLPIGAEPGYPSAQLQLTLKSESAPGHYYLNLPMERHGAVHATQMDLLLYMYWT